MTSRSTGTSGGGLRGLAVPTFAVGLLSLAFQAQAVPVVSAQQFYSVGGNPQSTVLDATVADVLPYYSVGPNSVFGHTYAYPSGTNGSRSSGTNTFSISGQSSWSETYTNNSGSTATFYFPYEITAGEVGVQMASDAVGTLAAGVAAEITFNGISVMSYAADATLDNTPGGGVVAHSFAETGTISLNGTTSTGSNYFSYGWNPYNGIVSMSLDDGESVDVVYALSSYANGTMTSLGTCVGTGIGGEPGLDHPTDTLVDGGGGQGSGPNASCFNAAVGRIGDPFNPSIVPQAVPEPVSLAVLGLGLAGVAATRRRRAA